MPLVEIRLASFVYRFRHLTWREEAGIKPAKGEDPRELLLARRSIELLREHRDDSFILYGAPNSGKTFLAAAIFTEAVAAWTDSDRFFATACAATGGDVLSQTAQQITSLRHARSSERSATRAVSIARSGANRPASSCPIAPRARALGTGLTSGRPPASGHAIAVFGWRRLSPRARSLSRQSVSAGARRPPRMKATESRVAALVALLKAYRDEDARIVVRSSLSPKELAARWKGTPGTDDLIAWMTAVKKRCVSDPA
jgi:hypothetical protein